MKRLLTLLCGLLAALALFGIMGLTVVDVAGRKLADHSLTGALEMTEILMVAVIFAGLPLVSLQGEHVVFDSLDAWLPRALRRAQQLLVDAACCAGLAGIAWLMWQKAAELGRYGETTAQLQMPLAPFVQAMAVLCALTALVHGALALTPAAVRGADGGERDGEGGGEGDEADIGGAT